MRHCTGLPGTRDFSRLCSPDWRRAACWPCRCRAISRRRPTPPSPEAARGGPWRARLEPVLRPAPVAAPDVYYGLLAPRTAALDIWETEYLQVLEGDDPVKEWTKGTWLKPLRDALEEPERSPLRGPLRGAGRSAAFAKHSGRAHGWYATLKVLPNQIAARGSTNGN